MAEKLAGPYSGPGLKPLGAGEGKGDGLRDRQRFTGGLMSERAEGRQTPGPSPTALRPPDGIVLDSGIHRWPEGREANCAVPPVILNGRARDEGGEKPCPLFPTGQGKGDWCPFPHTPVPSEPSFTVGREQSPSLP
jgi:hypothetical protein